jgi:hypothetical protein
MRFLVDGVDHSWSNNTEYFVIPDNSIGKNNYITQAIVAIARRDTGLVGKVAVK